jgi:hypothetical protein
MPGEQKSPAKQEKYGLRLDKYRRRVRLTYTVGAGLGTLVALLVGVLSGSLLDADPAVLKQLFITFFLITGACLAMAYIQFEWAVTLAERELDEVTDKAELLNSMVTAFPGDAKRAESWWSATRIMFGLTVVAFLVALWWPGAGTPTRMPIKIATPIATPTAPTPTPTPTNRPPTAPVTTRAGNA